MSFRVQFTISNEEYEILQEIAERDGFPNVPALCKYRTFCWSDIPQQEGKPYNELYNEMINNIAKYPYEKDFVLRDIIDTPPALLGVWLFKAVKNGKIPDVNFVGKDCYNIAHYIKIKGE